MPLYDEIKKYLYSDYEQRITSFEKACVRFLKKQPDCADLSDDYLNSHAKRTITTARRIAKDTKMSLSSKFNWEKIKYQNNLLTRKEIIQLGLIFDFTVPEVNELLMLHTQPCLYPRNSFEAVCMFYLGNKKFNNGYANFEYRYKAKINGIADNLAKIEPADISPIADIKKNITVNLLSDILQKEEFTLNREDTQTWNTIIPCLDVARDNNNFGFFLNTCKDEYCKNHRRSLLCLYYMLHEYLYNKIIALSDIAFEEGNKRTITPEFDNLVKILSITDDDLSMDNTNLITTLQERAIDFNELYKCFVAFANGYTEYTINSDEEVLCFVDPYKYMVTMVTELQSKQQTSIEKFNLIKFYKDKENKKANFESDELTKKFITELRNTFNFPSEGKKSYFLSEDETSRILDCVYCEDDNIFIVKENIDEAIKSFIDSYISFSPYLYTTKFNTDLFVEYLENSRCISQQQQKQKEKILTEIAQCEDKEINLVLTQLVRYWLGYTYSKVYRYPGVLRINEIAEIVYITNNASYTSVDYMGIMMNHNQRVRFKQLLSGKYDVPRNLFMMLGLFFETNYTKVNDILDISGYNTIDENISWDRLVKDICLCHTGYVNRVKKISDYLYGENLGKYTPIHSMINEIRSIYSIEMRGIIK